MVEESINKKTGAIGQFLVKKTAVLLILKQVYVIIM